MDEEKLKSALSFGGILLPDDIQRALEYYRIRKLKPGEFFLEAGQVAREIGFMSEGILRVYATDSEGIEVTKYFIRENQFAVNLESYYADMPSENAMQAVKMYTTAVCPYCVRAKQLLKARGVEHIEEIRIDTNPQERERMMETTGRRTVPQIFIGDTHVGGCDDLMALDARGGLLPLLGAA